MGYKHIRQSAVVALVLVTVIGMTATPVLANSTTATDDCDLVDIDGDNNEVAVDMHLENSEFSINCGDDGDGGDAGVSGASDDSDDSDDSGDTAGTTEVDVTVNDDDVHTDTDTSEDANIESGDGDQNVESGDGDQNVEDDAGDQNVEDDAGDQNIESGDGDQNIESGDGDQNVEDDEGDLNAESGEGDQATGGDGDDFVQNIDADDVVQFFLQQNFIDNDELRAAIANENVSNSTIVNNIVNGDQTINMNSRFVVDNSTTIIDNDTTVVYDNDTVTLIDDSNDTVINESGNGSVETGDGDQNIEDDEGDQIVGNNNTNVDDGAGDNATDDVNATAPDISVTKTADTDEVELDLAPTPIGTILVANEEITFTVVVTNEGDATATDVVVNDEDVIASFEDLDQTSAFLVLDSSTSQGNFSAVTGDFEVGTLAPGETATLTFEATAVSTDADLLDQTVLEIEATNNAELVSVSPDDPNADNDMGSATVTLLNLGQIQPLDEGASGQSVNNTTATGTATAATATGNNTSAALGFPMDSLAFGGLGLFGLLGSVLLLRRD